MKPADLGRELEKGGLRSAYLLAGEEALLRDDALLALRRHVLEGAAADFNLDRLRGAECSPQKLRDALRALPVMAQRRLVVLAEPDKGRGQAGRALLDALAEELAELAGRDDCVLVAWATRPDRRTRWVKAFGEAVVECEAPTQARSLLTFAREEARRQQVEIDAPALQLLVERIGPQLLMLRQELEKASLLAGPGAPVTRAHVEAASCDVAEESVWSLTDAIGEGRLADALALLASLQSDGAAPPALLGTLAAHFRKLARVRSGGAVGGPPFVVRKLESQARRYSAPRLRACLDAIHETDLALKGAGVLPPERALERLVLALAG